MDRRLFLQMAGAAGAAIAMPGAARGAQIAPRPRQAPSLYVDAQGFVDFDEPKPGQFVPSGKLIAALRDRRIDLVSITVGDVGNGTDRFKSATEGIASWDKVVGDHPSLVAKIERAADIQVARDSGRVGIIYNFQDSTPFETDSSNVGLFAALGVKIMQLTYNKRNLAGDGCLERSNAGLSDYGRELIGKIEEAHVLLDLSHSGQRTIAEGIAASKASPSITHSGCRALADLPRNTGDAEMRALADKGGVLGIYLMPFLRMSGQPGREDLLRHLDHAVGVCGEDHVGIGTDGPLTGYVIDDKMKAEHREFYEDRQKKGIAAPGEAADVYNLVEGYNDAARYDRIASDLGARGWSSRRVDKVLGGNWVRLFREVWRG